jgi:mRNA-degrading endonuclease RelE of RelBE toxin-antitoxin system
MEKYKKFLQKLPPSLRKRLIKTIFLIADNKLKSLDIKILHSKFCVYRCRVGKIRILFQKTETGNSIMDIGFRGDVYKKF